MPGRARLRRRPRRPRQGGRRPQHHRPRLPGLPHRRQLHHPPAVAARREVRRLQADRAALGGHASRRPSSRRSPTASPAPASASCRSTTTARPSTSTSSTTSTASPRSTSSGSSSTTSAPASPPAARRSAGDRARQPGPQGDRQGAAILAEQNKGLAQLAADSDTILGAAGPRARPHRRASSTTRPPPAQAAAERRDDIEQGFERVPRRARRARVDDGRAAPLRARRRPRSPPTCGSARRPDRRHPGARPVRRRRHAGADQPRRRGRDEPAPTSLASRGLIKDLGKLGKANAPGAKALNKLLVDPAQDRRPRPALQDDPQPRQRGQRLRRLRPLPPRRRSRSTTAPTCHDAGNPGCRPTWSPAPRRSSARPRSSLPARRPSTRIRRRAADAARRTRRGTERRGGAGQADKQAEDGQQNAGDELGKHAGTGGRRICSASSRRTAR